MKLATVFLVLAVGLLCTTSSGYGSAASLAGEMSSTVGQLPPLQCNYYVRLDGADDPARSGASNTSSQAWRTLGYALTRVDLSTGSKTVCLQGPGTYYEEVDIPLNLRPSASKTLTIGSDSGAILDGSTNFSTGWEEDSTIAGRGAGIYRRFVGSSVGHTPTYLTLNERYVPGIGAYPTQDSDATADAALKGGIVNYPEWSAPGVRDWTVTDFVWAVKTDGYVYVRFEDKRNPNGSPIRVSSKFLSGRWGTRGVLRTNGASYITIRGLTIQGSRSGIIVQSGSTNITITKNIFKAVDQGGVNVQAGASDITIIENDFTSNPYVKAGVTYSAASPHHWTIWKWYRNTSPDNPVRSGIHFTAASDGTTTIIRNVKIARNTFSRIFEGIAFANQASGASIEQNTFIDLLNDAIDTGSGGNFVVDAHVAGNRIVNANIGIRVGARDGSLYFYQNQYYFDERYSQVAEGTLVYFFRGTGASNFIYHNSISGHCCFTIGSTNTDTGLPNSYLWNNACSTANSICRYSTLSLSGSNIGYNWWFRAPSGYSGQLGPGNVIGTARMWPNTSVPDFEPPATSTGVDRLRDLAQNITTNAPVRNPWPRLDDGRNYDSQPDIGALQYRSAAADTVPPVISNMRASNITATSVTISWDLNEPGTGQVEYGTTTNYGLFSTLEPSFNYTSHSQTISGLSPNTLYNFRVLSRDRAGNLAVSPNGQFRTLSAAQPPQAPQRLRLEP